MKFSSSDVIVSLCVTGSCVLTGMGVLDTGNLMYVIVGALGYAGAKVPGK